MSVYTPHGYHENQMKKSFLFQGGHSSSCPRSGPGRPIPASWDTGLAAQHPFLPPPPTSGDLQVTPGPGLTLSVSSQPPRTPGSELPTTPPPPKAGEGGTGSEAEACTRAPCPAGQAGTRLSWPEEESLWGYCLSVVAWGRGSSEPGQGGRVTSQPTSWSAVGFDTSLPTPCDPDIPGLVLQPCGRVTLLSITMPRPLPLPRHFHPHPQFSQPHPILFLCHLS